MMVPTRVLVAILQFACLLVVHGSGRKGQASPSVAGAVSVSSNVDPKASTTAADLRVQREGRSSLGQARRRQPRRAGPFTALAGAAADAGDGLRARAQMLHEDMARGGGADGVVPGGNDKDKEDTASQSPNTNFRKSDVISTRRRKRTAAAGAARSLAFGKFPKVSKKKEEVEDAEESLSPEELALKAENDASVKEVMAVIESDGWEFVTRKRGIVVVKKFLPSSSPSAEGVEGAGGVVDTGAAAKFACVKAMGTLNADASELYKLFLDNERVHEYNDNCKELRDLERLAPDTKISWASTPRYGPFKARDFVTVVHYRTLDDGTMVVVNRPVEHDEAKRGKKYVRAEILIATNIMRPNPDDPTKTDFISVTHINPGGIVDSTIGAKLSNKLCAKAPVNLLLALEKAANTPPPQRKS